MLSFKNLKEHYSKENNYLMNKKCVKAIEFRANKLLGDGRTACGGP
jgi:hypothetical protein